MWTKIDREDAETLPPEFLPVLVSIEPRVPGSHLKPEVLIYTAYWTGYGWLDFTGRALLDLIQVTHWQRLPELPEEAA